MASTRLFLQAQDEAGAGAALEEYGPRLEAFLGGRLPAGARGHQETLDLVQAVWAKALEGRSRFTDHGAGAFWAYLRRIAENHLVDQYRRAGRRGTPEPLPPSSEEPPATGAGPAEEIERKEACALFDRALSVVSEEERRAVLARLELDQPWDEIAEEAGFPSPDAARMAVRRALTRIHREMSRHVE